MSEASRIKNLPILLRRGKLKEKLVNLCKENDIVFMALFGSFAKGDYKKKSDIDILIKFKEKRGKSLFDLLEVEEKLKNIFGRKVDLLTIGSISPYLRKEILATKKVIYEKR